MAKLSPKSRKTLRAKAVSATRGIIDAMLERKRDGPPSVLQTPSGDLIERRSRDHTCMGAASRDITQRCTHFYPISWYTRPKSVRNRPMRHQ